MSVRGVALCALCVLGALCGIGCEARPAECDAALVDRVAALNKQVEKQGLIGLSARQHAMELATKALAAAQKQDDRFRWFRSYSAAKTSCVEAAAAVKQAEDTVKSALAQKPRVEAIDTEGKARLASAQKRIDAAGTMIDTGLFGDDVVAAQQKTRRAFEEARHALDRARAEITASGFAGDVAPLDAARAAAVKADDDSQQQLTSVASALAHTCHIPEEGLVDATLKMHEGWLVLEVPQAHKVMVLETVREKKSCRSVYARPESGADIGGLDDELYTWNIPGVIPSRLLVGFGKSRAWFLDGARFSSFSHGKAAGFSAACLASVSCGAPRIGTRTLEADCDCNTQAAGMVPSDLKRTARYAWDGNHVIAEP